MAFRCAPHPPWTFEFASEGCLALTGWRPETFYAGGKLSWVDIMEPEDRERVIRAAEAAFQERRQLTDTYRIRTRSGEQRWLWCRIVALVGAEGKLESLEGFVTDISQQKEAEEEVKRRAEFEQQLIGIVSHDLRNPLNAIILGAATLLRREGLDNKSANSVRRILNSAERATRMIRDLLDFTQVRFKRRHPSGAQAARAPSHAGHVLEEMRAHPPRAQAGAQP